MSDTVSPLGRRGATPPSDTKADQDVRVRFQTIQKPLVDLQPPEITPTVAPQGEPAIDIEKLKKGENQNNKEKLERAARKSSELWTFAKRHPFLTVGFAIGLVLLIASFHSFAMALSGSAHLSVLDAHLVIGGSIIAMGLYYAIYLINLARRGALKDSLEERIKFQEKITEDLRDARVEQTEEIIAKINKEITTLSEENAKQLQQIKSEYETTQDELKRSQPNLEKIKSYQTWLKKYYAENVATLGPWKGIVENALDNASHAVAEGSKELNLETMPHNIPAIPHLELTVPEKPTEAMVQNQGKLAAISQKLGDFTQNAIDLVDKNRGSMSFILTGIFFTALSGAAIYFWLHGSSSIFFVGPLTAFTIVPMAIYGLSLIYEGYNSATINRLNQALQEAEENNQRMQETLEEEKETIRHINDTAIQSLSDFRTNWKNVLDHAHEVRAEAIERLNHAQVKVWPTIEAQCRALLESLSQAFPELNKEQGLRILLEKMEGAGFTG